MHRQAGAAGGGEIGAAKAARVQHAAQPVVHIAAAGDEHDARRAAVEPVDGVENRVGAEIGGERIGDRGVAAVVPAVDGHAGRLVEREQVGVLIQNVQRHGHGREPAAGALVVDAHGEGVPRRDAVDRAGVHAVYADAVRHGLDAGDGAVGHAQFTPEQALDRAACLLRRDGERQPAHSCAASAASYAARVRLSKQTMRTRVISGWPAR